MQADLNLAHPLPTHQSTCKTNPLKQATGWLPLLWLHNRLQLIAPLNAQLCSAASFCQEGPRAPFSRACLHFPKGWPGNFPLQEILPLPCHPSPASPHGPSQVTITTCLQHMTAVTFLACFTPQSCHPTIKCMKTVGAKRNQPPESEYLNGRLSGSGDPHSVGKSDLFKEIYLCPFILPSPPTTPVLTLLQVSPYVPRDFSPSAVDRQLTPTLSTLLISYAS